MYENMSVEVLVGIIAGLELEVAKLKSAVERDEFTGLLNKSAGELKLRELCAGHHSRRTDNFILAIIDLDKFKSVNDTYGHGMGDAVISSICDIIKSELRDGQDLGIRFGGDEYVVALKDVDLSEALEVLYRIRNKFQSLEFKANGQTFSCTFSCGMAQHLQDETYQELFDRADAALYEVKSNGRGSIRTNFQKTSN